MQNRDWIVSQLVSLLKLLPETSPRKFLNFSYSMHNRTIQQYRLSKIKEDISDWTNNYNCSDPQQSLYCSHVPKYFTALFDTEFQVEFVLTSHTQLIENLLLDGLTLFGQIGGNAGIYLIDP